MLEPSLQMEPVVNEAVNVLRGRFMSLPVSCFVSRFYLNNNIQHVNLSSFWSDFNFFSAGSAWEQARSMQLGHPMNTPYAIPSVGQSSEPYFPRLFPCPQCHRQFRWKANLKAHMRLECGKEPSFFCPYCPHRTKLKGNLMKHIRSRHGRPGDHFVGGVDF